MSKKPKDFMETSRNAQIGWENAGKELARNKLSIMRRISLARQGGGRRHSGAMSTDDNAV